MAEEVTITTLDNAKAVLLERNGDECVVAYQRFGAWKVETFPAMSVQTQPRGVWGWVQRKLGLQRNAEPRASFVEKPLPTGTLPADIKMPPGR